MKTALRADFLRQLNCVQDHLEGIRRLLERDESCARILRRTYAVRKAIQRMEAMLLQAHLHHCLAGGSIPGSEAATLAEVSRLYRRPPKARWTHHRVLRR
ncbi:MAG: hypothetical protein A2148_01430 [Chloroflexi bacterium RBG_16_68_14]|nr:MAG: hypothetical protein A2148_01430 [Chloroflexi bacterium RBG_16_68_14]